MAKRIRIPAFAELVRALRPDESMSRTQRLPLNDDEPTDGKEALARLRNQVNQAVSKARRDDGSNFKVESGAFITDDYTAMIVTVAVTRLSGVAAASYQGEDDEEMDI